MVRFMGNRKVTIRGFQLIAHLALRGQGQASLRNRGSSDIAAQALQLAPLIGPDGNAGVEIEPADLPHCTADRFIDIDRW